MKLEQMSKEQVSVFFEGFQKWLSLKAVQSKREGPVFLNELPFAGILVEAHLAEKIVVQAYHLTFDRCILATSLDWVRSGLITGWAMHEFFDELQAEKGGNDGIDKNK